MSRRSSCRRSPAAASCWARSTWRSRTRPTSSRRKCGSTAAATLLDWSIGGVLHRRGQRSVPDAEFLAAERRRVPGEPAHRRAAEHLRGVRGLRHAHLAPHAEARFHRRPALRAQLAATSSRSAPARWFSRCRSAARRTASSRTRRRSAIARARSSCLTCATRRAIGPAARTQSQRPERPAARRSDVRCRQAAQLRGRHQGQQRRSPLQRRRRGVLHRVGRPADQRRAQRPRRRRQRGGRARARARS